MMFFGKGLGASFSPTRKWWGQFSNNAIPPNVSGNMGKPVRHYLNGMGCNTLSGIGDDSNSNFLLWGTIGVVGYLLLFNKPGGIFRKK